MASPLFGSHTDAGDPIAAFDNAGNLFVGGISFNRVKPSNGDVYVATYGANPTPSGYPVDYLRTIIVGRGTPSSVQGGIFQDKPMLEVDRSGGPNDGNVYVCWSRFTGSGQTRCSSAAQRTPGRRSAVRSPSPAAPTSVVQASTSPSRPTATCTSRSAASRRTRTRSPGWASLARATVASVLAGPADHQHDRCTTRSTSTATAVTARALPVGSRLPPCAA